MRFLITVIMLILLVSPITSQDRSQSRIQGQWVLSHSVIRQEDDVIQDEGLAVDTLIFGPGDYVLLRYSENGERLIYRDNGKYKLEGNTLVLFDRQNSIAKSWETMKTVRREVRIRKNKLKLSQYVSFENSGTEPTDSLFMWFVYDRIK